MSDRLFDLDEVPEVPIFREPRGRRGAAVGSSLDARFLNDYPPEWWRCQTCNGSGRGRLRGFPGIGEYGMMPESPKCLDCLGMGSVKGRVRLEAGHRCVRCQHPFMTRGDAKMLGVDPTPGRWSPCDKRCTHSGTIRYRPSGDAPIVDDDGFRVVEPVGWESPASIDRSSADVFAIAPTYEVEAEWRVLTVHHLDGDKANLRWWNLAALCQRCHLQIQGKVVMERVYPHEHSEWFKPFVAGYYAWVYLAEELTRPEVEARMDELLALELAPA